MWLTRLRRRRPPPVLQPALDRLAELIERVVALLDELTPNRPEEGPPEPRAEEAAARPAEATAMPSDDHVLVVPAASGYHLIRREGPPPERGATLRLDEGVFRVLRIGASPLPEDTSPCAFLEREEGLGVERTSTGEGREPDRGDAGGPARG
jgi:hypothetical protein